MSLQYEPEQVANSNLCSNEQKEKIKLMEETQEKLNLQKSHSSSNGPIMLSAISSSASPLTTQQSLGYSISGESKPTLIRQDRTCSSYLASPQLSTLGTSEEASDDDNAKSIQYHLRPTSTRCRHCHLNERRSSVSPSSVIHIPRSNSKEILGLTNSVIFQSIPPVFVTGSTTRTIQLPRQSSQPETATHSCCGTHTQQTSSLRQLRDASDPIAGIATETLRVVVLNLFY